MDASAPEDNKEEDGGRKEAMDEAGHVTQKRITFRNGGTAHDSDEHHTCHGMNKNIIFHGTEQG